MAELNEYKILMASFDSPVPSDDYHAPWATSADEFDFSEARFDTVIIRDDDPEYKSGRSDPNETYQTLINSTAFGGETDIAAPGTKLSNYPGSIIQDSDGNRFFVTYPWTFYKYRNGGQLLGAKKSVLIFPLKNEDSGEYSSFDPKGVFHFVSISGQENRKTLATPYEPRATVPCFAEGTLIRTVDGERPIEALRKGDLVLTRDMGPQRIRWIGQSRVDAARLDLCPNLRPIRIAAGALGPRIPDRDLDVSPQHRILLRSPKTLRLFDEEEVLVAAKHLVRLPGIDAVLPETGVTYWHMLFDRHQVVLSNGAWTESLYPGPMAMQSLGTAARREIFSLFPDLRSCATTPQAARRLLSGAEGREIARRQAKNGNKPLFCRHGHPKSHGLPKRSREPVANSVI